MGAEKIRTLANCPDLQLRDARRTFESVTNSAGKSLEDVSRMLHHTSATTTRRYAFLFDEVQKVHVAETAREMQKLMGGKAA
ncbi:MAG: hypothetical protein NW215_00390 [Hyphomicrobiales bacterium]|nr:hypothetical protein [Hyphomicrobiales bacterium]